MVKTGLNEKQINTWLTQRMERSDGRVPSSKMLSSSSASSSSSNHVVDNSLDSSSSTSSSTQFAISGPTPSKKRCVEGMIRSPTKAQRKLDSSAFSSSEGGKRGGGGGGEDSENQPPTKEEGGWTSRVGGLRPVAKLAKRRGANAAAPAAALKAAAEAKRNNENKVVFRIQSSDGFFLESENIDEAWINITAKIQWGMQWRCIKLRRCDHHPSVFLFVCVSLPLSLFHSFVLSLTPTCFH